VERLHVAQGPAYHGRAMVNAVVDKSKPLPQNGNVPEVGKYVHMKVPPSEIEEWKARAVVEKRSLNNFVRHAIEVYLRTLAEAN